MLEQMLEKSGGAKIVESLQSPLLVGSLSAGERQSLPKSMKDFSELMRTTTEAGSSELSLLQPSPLLESPPFDLAKSDYPLENLVLNQLSVSTGKDVFKPVASLLTDVNQGDLMNEAIKLNDSDVLINEASSFNALEILNADVSDLDNLESPSLLSSSNLFSPIENVLKEVDGVDVALVLDVPEVIANPAVEHENMLNSQGNNQMIVQDEMPQIRPIVDSMMVKPEKGEKSENIASWGVSSTSNSSSPASQSGFQQGASGQPQGQSQQNQVMFSQMQQEQKMTEQNFKFQMLDERVVAKTLEVSADKEKLSSLLGGVVQPLDKQISLPLGLQSINTPVRHPQWGQALGQRIVVMANDQIQEAKISLNPEKLGPIQIKLSMDKDQQVHVVMYAQYGVTREAMESALPKLKEMLEQSGISFGSLDVGDQKQFEQNQSNERSSESTGSKNNDAVDESVAEKSNVLVTKTDNLVDYYA